MKSKFIIVFLFFACLKLAAQIRSYAIYNELNLDSFENGKIHKLWLQLGEDVVGNPLKVPVLLAKGAHNGNVLGLTAAIHGNELNGIAIIHDVFNKINVNNLTGTIIGIPGLNPLAIENNQREYIDGQDLNRVFPGKAKGNRSQQMAYQIGNKIIPLFNYHIDLHTASFGRINSLYGRGDMENETLANILRVLQPDIIVSNKGEPSFGETTGLTMRAFATVKGLHSVTMEYGNPQVYQTDMVERGVRGIFDVLTFLDFIEGNITLPEPQNICSKSYWIYTDKGGYLEIFVQLNQKVTHGERLAVLKNAFGEIIDTYYIPEDGIVIGKSTNPVNSSGGRIIHLGILANR